MAAPTLTVIAGPDKDRAYTLKQEKCLMGRHQDCLYRLTNDLRVSRYHCEIDFDGQSVTVSNHGNTSGTLINGVAITVPTVLYPGDTLQVGESTLRYDNGANVTATLPPGIHGTLKQAAEYDVKATDELALLVNRSLLRFQIGEVLGKSTNSMVFRAVNGENGKQVALRIMQPAFAQDEEEVQRFVRAMKATMPFNHPNIIHTFAAGKNGPYCWVELELIDGEALTDEIRRIGVAGMLDWKRAFRVGLQIGRALDYIHKQGVIHRDITPAQIIVDRKTRTAKLGNLMLAKALEGTLARQITRPGEIVGDVNYMSPERTSGGAAIDARSDLFSLGATCYALLSGKSPFAGATLVETLTKIRSSEPLKPSTFQLGIPSSFEHAILKMLAKLPVDRYQTAADWVKELEKLGKSNGAAID